ncbi:MAG: ABC transporter ATP-binding protein [Nitrososphaerota archaeon]
MLEVRGLEVRRGVFRLVLDELRVVGRVGLLGRNGTGKSTLLRCLAGFIKPTKGRILLDGNDITNTPPSLRGVGYLPQEQVRLPLKPGDAIKYFERRFGVSGAEVVDRLGMASLLRKPALSLGENQIVNLAIVMMKNPRLLLLDEPTANLDFLNKITFWKVLENLRIPLLYVSHDPLEASLIGESIYLIEEGRVKGPYLNPLKPKAVEMLEELNLYKKLEQPMRADTI